MIPISLEKIKFIISIAREYREGSLAMVSEELSEPHKSDTYTEHSLAGIVEKAIENARSADNNHTAEYLIDTPLLPDYLEEGLTQLADD